MGKMDSYQGVNDPETSSQTASNSIPGISVIVLNYNGLVHLKECLDSLERQTFRAFETILVDNGSTDDSVGFVTENFPWVRVLKLEENRGFCGGNNAGISIAKGEFVALLNNDTRADPDWLLELYQAMSMDQKAGFCASKVVLYDRPGCMDVAGDGLAICGAPFKRGHLGDAHRFNRPEYVFGASGAACLYRRSMLIEVGGFDEDFFAIFEDGDLSFRCQMMGFKCIYVPAAIVYHKVNATLKPLSNFYVYYGQRNVEYLYVKNMPTPLMIRYFHLHILYVILAWGYFILKGRGLIFLKAKFDALKDLPIMLRKRLEIQKKRKVSLSYLEGMMERDWLRTRIKRD